MMRGGNREMRRMLDRMGLDMKELPNVQEVIIKTDKKEIIIPKPAVTEMKSKDNSIFQVIATSYEEKELETPIFSEEDIMLVSQQANVSAEVAANALKETGGDLARAILLLSTK
ncbi:MAG: nascent polypeptide-associated complex protein [Candidatus Nitrosotenuis sp.]|uniref:Nascent polypeptide-associated complex protein n=1 Tax=Candidatus Nitrosotenuis uzonensis TaxID=1407055 RepID=V6AV96_9ARCH|nr:nascent polypeptide-associated complex protein [Candidatus Nitrosotenuis uzonensis]CDI06403.1 Nascent polypeptide-associated complex protein [Candidatus Nitrosotenuis uzonensis]